MISENKKLSLCGNCKSRTPLPSEIKRKLWEEKAILDKLVDEIHEASGSLIQR
jgi:hypothetical protein